MQSSLTTKLHEIVWLMDRQADTWLKKKHGISFAQFRVLMTLQATAPISQKGLAECLLYSDAAVSRMVKILPDYITIRAIAGRTRILALTPKGQALVKSCAGPLEKMFRSIVVQSGVDVKKYLEQTDKIREKLYTVNNH